MNSRRGPIQAVRLGSAAILIDDGEQDGDEGRKSDEIEERPMLIARCGEGHERPVDGEESEGPGEARKKPVGYVSPEPKEEQGRQCTAEHEGTQ